jgi:Na+/phosphate symporter
MSKASSDELAELHKVVAKVLNHQISDTVEFEDEETGERKQIFTATPATISAAIKFLNDNDISCDPKDDDNLSDLAEKLNKKRLSGRGKLKPVTEDFH